MAAIWPFSSARVSFKKCDTENVMKQFFAIVSRVWYILRKNPTVMPAYSKYYGLLLKGIIVFYHNTFTIILHTTVLFTCCENPVVRYPIVITHFGPHSDIDATQTPEHKTCVVMSIKSTDHPVWPCVTDNSGIITYGLTALGREMSTPPILQLASASERHADACCSGR